jgi:hypothetical protein
MGPTPLSCHCCSRASAPLVPLLLLCLFSRAAAPLVPLLLSCLYPSHVSTPLMPLLILCHCSSHTIFARNLLMLHGAGHTDL